MSALYFDARIDGAKLQQDINNINRQLGRITETVKKEGSEIDGLAKRMGASFAGAFSVFAGGSFVKDIARVRGEFQQLEVAFETMLGSKAEADKLMAQVVDFAATTPFELQDVASGAKQLLAYGTAAEDIIPTLKALGDVSAGLSVPIERLILNYGQVRTQLKMTGKELRDFNVAGVPIVAELAKNMGVAESKIADMVEAGKIGFPEVEKAFQTMTSQGGRFNDLMDKQAKTITGLASNFSDAWNKMLNSIGQQNEGIIADTIRGATELTTHYEEVIKILGILVATYGTYKAAVIATSVATAAARTYGIYDIATKQLQAGATLKAAAAQTALNTAMKVNPYILIASLVAGLATSLIIFGNNVKKTEDYINDLNDAINGLGKQADIDSLIERYDKLKVNTEKTKEEQEEFNQILRQLSLIFPDAVDKWGDYGQAIELAYLELVKMNDELRNNAKEVANKELVDTQAQINKLLETRKRLQSELNAGGRTYNVTDPTTGIKTSAFQKFDKKDRENAQKELATVSSDLDKLATKASEAQGIISTVGKIDVDRFKNSYKELFDSVGGLADAQLTETKKRLEDLLKTNTNPDFVSAIKKQIDLINAELKLPTVEQQINKAKTDIAAAEARIKALQSSKSRTKTEQIKDQQEIIKSNQEILNAYGIETGKKAKKTLEEQKKAKQEQLQAEQDFAEKQLDVDLQLSASRIAIMKNGAEREKAEAELAFQQKLAQIKQQEQEYLKAYNAERGFKEGDKGYINNLPVEAFEQFDTLRINAEIEKNDKIKEINKNSAEEIKAIWDGVNEVYLTGNQKEVKSINEKYDNLVKAAQKGGASLVDIAAINAARLKEVTESNKNYETDIALAKVELEEQIAARRYSIQADGFASEMLLMKKSFDAYKKTQQQKIDILNNSGKPEDKAQAKILTEELGVEQFNAQMNAIKMISEEIFNVMSGITSQLEEQGYLTQEEAAYAQEWLKAISDGKVAQKAVSEAISALIRSFPESSASVYAKQIERINQALKEQQRLIDEAKRTGGMEEVLRGDVELAKKQNKTYEKLLEDAKDKLDNTFGGKLNPFYNSRVNAVNELTIAVNDSRNAVEDAEQALNDFLAGGVTQNTIADVIAEGFQSGKTSVDDFAQYMNDVLLDAVMNVFKAEILGPAIDGLADYIKNSLADGILTPEEKTEIDRRTKEIADTYKPFWDNLTGALKLPGADANSQKGLTGAIKGITEETAGMIAGQFFAFREVQQKTYLTGVEQLDAINQTVTHLAKIEVNTRPIAKLNEIAETLLKMNTKIQSDL